MEKIEGEGWYTSRVKKLFEGILLLKTLDECAQFFRDLLTLEELAEISTRWQIAMELFAGKKVRHIAKELGVSSATVSRTHQWLRDGKGGYKLILKKIEEGNK